MAFDSSEFAKAYARLPKPISCFADGAVCPWCGCVHRTITFGSNHCSECQRGFSFGYPEYYEGKDPISYVPFPFREFDALGQRADMLEDWKPNDRLKHHYHDKMVERTGFEPDHSKPQ